MPYRTVTYDIDDRRVRRELASRKEPYWTRLSEKRFLGFSKWQSWSWRAKCILESGQKRHRCLGTTADSPRDRWNLERLTFDQAVVAAQRWLAAVETTPVQSPTDRAEWRERPLPATGSYTVAHAYRDWLLWKESAGEFNRRHLTPFNYILRHDLGAVALLHLEARDISTWLQWIIALAPHTSNVQGPMQEADPDRANDRYRRRKRSANLYLDALKNALTFAYHSGMVDSDLAWRSIRRFPNVETPQPVFLSDAAIKRLRSTCRSDLVPLLDGILVTGCRPSELVSIDRDTLQYADGRLRIYDGKQGRFRSVLFGSEGRAWCERVWIAAPYSGPALRQRNNRPWTVRRAGNALREERRRLGIDAPVTLRNLRQHYASKLFERGVPLPIISRQLGHSSPLVTARFYAHLSSDVVDDTLRQYLD